MKFVNYSIALFSIAVLCLTSACKDDEKEIAGTYKISKLSNSSCTDPNDNFSFDLSANNGCYIEDDILICETFSLIITESSLSMNYSYSENDSILFSDSNSYTYTLSGDEFTWCDPANECIIATYSLTDSGLLTMSQHDEVSGCDNYIEAQRQ